jgi:hypothetical protein
MAAAPPSPEHFEHLRRLLAPERRARSSGSRMNGPVRTRVRYLSPTFKPRPGMTVTEAELVEFLGSELGERAALPRRIRGVKDALETALREAGVPFRRLEINQDRTAALACSWKAPLPERAWTRCWEWLR